MTRSPRPIDSQPLVIDPHEAWFEHGLRKIPQERRVMSRSNSTADAERLKAKHHIKVLLRWDRRRRIEIVVTFLACLVYVVLALINGWTLSVGKVPSWCSAPIFVCGTPFLLFILSTILRPTARAGVLERAFRDQSNLGKEVMAVGEMIVEDEGIATQDDLEKLEQVLSRLSVEMEKAMGAGANRFEIFYFVEMSLKEELGEHGVLNRNIRRRVNEFIEANRI